MPDLRFGVLGPLEALRDGERVLVPSGRRRAVLACLLVHAGRPVTADVLAEAAWGEALPVDPKAALHTVLSRLRSLFGTAVFRAEPGGYLLDVPADAVDAHRFEALRGQAASASPTDAGRLLDDALGLWRGPAYAEFADRDFAMAEAHRLDRARLDTIEERAALAIEVGDVETAIGGLAGLLAEQPFREHAVQLLMTALYRAGRATEALERGRAYRATLADELGIDPSPALRDLEWRILGHELPRPVAPNLGPPAWLDTSTAFVGRDRELADLTAAVSANRVVTVTGVGGVGKSRLVAQALPTLSERLTVPITVVELAAVRSGRVAAEVADALRLTSPAGSVRDSLIEYLSVSTGILVLDNCEHLLSEVATLTEAVTRRCPRVRVLATSRRRLGVATEAVLPLAPLPVAERVERLEDTAAVRLFTDRVRRVRPSFGVTRENLQTVADICRLADGLPLALELAAARTGALGLRPVREELADPGGPGDRLRAVVDWSYRLLSAAQRRLLAALSVFPAEFDVEAVQGLAVALGAWHDGRAVAGPLAELVEASLLSTGDAGGEVRYRMLAIVRAFAAERLADSGEAEDVRLAHATWVRRLVERAAADNIGTRSADALILMNRNRADIDAAARWALAAGRESLAAAITGAVGLFPHRRLDIELSELVVAVAEQCAAHSRAGSALAVAAGGHDLAGRGEFGRGADLARAALRLAVTPVERFRACLAMGVATLYAGRHQESAEWWREIIGMAELPSAYRADAHLSLALLHCYADELPAARAQAALGLTLAESAGAEAVHAFAQYAAGEVAVKTDPERAAELFAQAAAQADRVRADHVSEVARLARLAILVRLGRYDEALDLAGALLRDEHRSGAWPQLWTTMRILAELLAARDRPRDAAFLLAAAATAESAPPVTGEDVQRYGKLTAQLRERLGVELLDRMGDLAGGIPRAQILDRALTLLVELGASKPETVAGKSV